MRRPRIKLWTLGLMVLVAACGSPTVGDGANAMPKSSSPTFAQEPSALGHLPRATATRLNTTAPATCVGDVGATDPVAIVTLKGEARQVLRDYADDAHPRTFCSFDETLYVSSILDPHHVLV